MNIHNKTFPNHFYSICSIPHSFQINPQSLRIAAIFLIVFTSLASFFYLLYGKVRLKNLSSLNIHRLTCSSLSSVYQQALNGKTKTLETNQRAVIVIQDILKQNSEGQYVYSPSVSVPIALLRKLVQKDIFLNERELTSLQTLKNSKGETFSLTGFEKALLMQHSIPFKNFWSEKRNEKISLIESEEEFNLLKIVLESVYEPKILEKKEREICSLAKASFKFQLNEKAINACLEKLLVTSFEKNETNNIHTLLQFFKSYQKPLTPFIQQALQIWLNRSIGTPTFPAYLLILKDSSITTLDFSGTLINNQELSYLSGLSLSTLILKNCPITDDGVKHLQNLTQLKKLILAQCHDVQNQSLKNLQSLTHLQHLDLRGCCEITDEGLKELKKFTHLQNLNLGGCYQITNQGLENLDRLMQLQKLNLNFCTKIANQGLKNLRNLTHLKKLNLKNCINIKEQDLKDLQSFTQLQKINLEGCYELSNESLKDLKVLTYLQELNLSYCYNITDDGLSYLENLTELKKLNLGWCDKITNQGLKHLQSLTQLQELNLHHCSQITNEGLQVLQIFTQLQKLNLNLCFQITNEGLIYLQNFPQLQSLDLSRCDRITDQGLIYLQKLTQLQNLSLSFCNQITDQGLIYLQEITQLKNLILLDCKQISSKAINVLQNKGIKALK